MHGGWRSGSLGRRRPSGPRAASGFSMVACMSLVVAGWYACWRGVLAMLELLAVGLIVVALWASAALADGGAGSALAWGENAFGELGDGSMTSSSVPVSVSGSAIPAGTTFTQLAVGGGHSLALSSAGQVYAWGYILDGQLGDGGTASSSVPVVVSGGAIPAGTTFTQIAAGASVSLALSSTGQVYAWGFDTNGELGNGSMSSSPVPVSVSVPIGTTFTQIAAGGYHGLALSSTGKVYAWGLNEYGELGNGTQTGSLVPVAVSSGLTFSQIT